MESKSGWRHTQKYTHRHTQAHTGTHKRGKREETRCLQCRAFLQWRPHFLRSLCAAGVEGPRLLLLPTDKERGGCRSREWRAAVARERERAREREGHNKKVQNGGWLSGGSSVSAVPIHAAHKTERTWRIRLIRRLRKEEKEEKGGQRGRRREREDQERCVCYLQSRSLLSLSLSTHTHTHTHAHTQTHVSICAPLTTSCVRPSRSVWNEAKAG